MRFRHTGMAGTLSAAAAVVVLTAAMTSAPMASAVSPPPVDPSLVPADGRPGPEQAMRQSNLCARTIAIAEPSVNVPSPGFRMLNVAEAWQYSTGNGVVVAVIDTGISPNPRLPVISGGDYVAGGDGLTDCDAHGTTVASVIAAAPRGLPPPAPMPPKPPIESPNPERSSAEPVLSDGVIGVAPHATLISIRQSSRAFEPQNPGPGDAETRKKAGTLTTLARAIVHAANLGAKVINISVAACVPAADPLDQRTVGAAVWYAAAVKDAVVVAAAGNEGEDGCVSNPASGPLDSVGSRNWERVRTVSSPSWFSDYVLSIGAVDTAGVPMSESLAGPWVGAAAPGVGIVGLSPQDATPVNAYQPARAGDREVPFWGTSFAAAYVSGVAALVRARYPKLSAHQVIHRIQQTAHNPPRGVDDQVGYGVVDPIAALTFDVAPGPRTAPGAPARVISPPPEPAPPDRRARDAAIAFTAAVAAIALLAATVTRARRAK